MTAVSTSAIAGSTASREHDADDLIRLFWDCFGERYQTELVRGDDEPVYLPMGPERSRHQIVFAHGYFASALHEIAHWCVAGAKRRQQVDFGYWYQPDGRTAQQQRNFERVEVKPQALEWIFSVAAGFRFRFSADNLSGETVDMTAFRQAVHARVMMLLTKGLPRRARCWTEALAQSYGVPLPLRSEQFDIDAAVV